MSSGGLVLLAFVAWNGGNYLFFLLAGRLLGVDEYGLLAALLAVTVVASVPCNALQMEVARQVAAHGRVAGATVSRRAVAGAAWIGPALAVLATGLAGLLALGGDVPVGPLAVTFVAIAWMPVLFLGLGQLQGEHRFGAYAGSFSVLGGVRPLLLVPLVAIGLGVYSGLVATAAAVVLAAGLALVAEPLLVRGPGAPTQVAWRQFRHAVPVVAFGLAGIAVLTNVDVIAGRVWLTPTQSGQFAAVAVLAKAVIVVPQTVSTVLLPRIASRSHAQAPTVALLAIGVLSALAAGLVGVLVGLVAAEPIIRITFGSEFTGLAWLLAPFAAASGLLGALIILVNHHVGRRSTRFAWAMGGVAVAYVLGLVLFHGSPEAIVIVNIAAGVLGLVVHEALFLGRGESILEGLRALPGAAAGRMGR